MKYVAQSRIAFNPCTAQAMLFASRMYIILSTITSFSFYSFLTAPTRVNSLQGFKLPWTRYRGSDSEKSLMYALKTNQLQMASNWCAMQAQRSVSSSANRVTFALLKSSNAMAFAIAKALTIRTR